MTHWWSPLDPEPIPLPKVPGWWAIYTIVVPGIPSAEAFGTPNVALTQSIFVSGIPSAEAFGSVTLKYNQTIGPAGIPSLEAFGGSQLDPGDINVLPQAITSQEAFGTPTVTPGTANIFAAGITSAETFGAITVSTGPVNIAVTAGIGSLEAVGTPSVSYLIGPNGIISEEAFGQAQLSYTVAPLGIPSAEAFGTANVIGPPQAITPTGIASLEAFGGSALQPGAVNLLPQGITSGEVFGTAALSVGPVSLTPAGIASAEAFGTLHLSRNITTSGIPSAEAFGAHSVSKDVAPTGIASAEAFGTATVEIINAPTASVIASAVGTGTSVAIPTHQVGDLLLITTKANSGTPPTKPSAAGTVPSWTTIDSGSGGSTGIHTAYAVATATNHTTGTWTNCNGISITVIRGQMAGTPIGGHTITGGTTGVATTTALTLSQTDGSSVQIYSYSSNQLGSGGWVGTPTGYTRRAAVGSLNTAGMCVNSKDDTTTDGAIGQTGSGGLSVWTAIAIEVRAH